MTSPIDLEAGAIGITDADRVADVPVFEQSVSINFPTAGSTDAFRNSTEQAIGIANAWSVGAWFKPVVPITSSPFLWVLAPTTGNVNRSRINIYHDSSSNRLRVDLADTSGSPVEVTAFNNFYTGENGNWVHVLIVWTGTQFFALKNGVDFGAPDVGSATPSITMADTLRSVGFGNQQVAGNSSIQGNLAQGQIWNADVRSAASFLNTNPSSLDLNVDSGAYTFAGNLAHWFRPGHEADPNLGKDFAEAGITPTIDVGVNKLGLFNSDMQADVP